MVEFVVTPTESPKPNIHPRIEECEFDLDWFDEQEEKLSVKQMDDLRKENGRLACVGIVSRGSDNKIRHAME